MCQVCEQFSKKVVHPFNIKNKLGVFHLNVVCIDVKVKLKVTLLYRQLVHAGISINGTSYTVMGDNGEL